MALFGIPVITSISPNTGSPSGGNSVTITGTGFTGATAVTFGSNPATFTVVTDTTITSIAPISAAGNANITVTTPSGSSSPSNESLYVYQGNWFLYDADGGDGVYPISLPTNTPEPVISLSASPTAIAITPDGQTVLFLSNNASGLIFIDAATNTVIGSTLFTSSTSAGVAVTPDGKSAYVAANNRLIKIDIATRTIESTLSTPLVRSLAITPDGTRAYATGQGVVYVVDLASNTVIDTLSPPVLSGIEITPDGTQAYALGQTGVNIIDLATNTVVSHINITMAFAVAITPDGQLAFVSSSSTGLVSVIDIASQSIIATIPLPNGTLTGRGITVTPDGKTVYVADLSAIVPIDVETLTAGAPLSIGSLPIFLAVTPDQAPVASFTFTSPSTFDASSSRTAVGSIASYSWDFGDGQTLVTSSPIVTHDYLASGTYIVTLTVTNTAGTSTTQIFTGQTVSRNGGPSAVFSQTVVVEIIGPVIPLPPSNFAGKSIKNQFATQTEYINRLKWTPSPDPSVATYQLYRNGRLIAVIPANGPFVYSDHNRRKHSTDVYTLIAVSADGTQSPPVMVTVHVGSH